mmetsp:Transcript_29335/g.94284  ORF Transcript_29335/g.94284 Transcript_29335/m.94284 type:complete len:208 (+) Transcript_29335:1331-1954(+)
MPRASRFHCITRTRGGGGGGGGGAAAPSSGTSMAASATPNACSLARPSARHSAAVAGKGWEKGWETAPLSAPPASAVGSAAGSPLRASRSSAREPPLLSGRLGSVPPSAAAASPGTALASLCVRSLFAAHAALISAAKLCSSSRSSVASPTKAVSTATSSSAEFVFIASRSAISPATCSELRRRSSRVRWAFPSMAPASAMPPSCPS